MLLINSMMRNGDNFASPISVLFFRILNFSTISTSMTTSCTPTVVGARGSALSLRLRQREIQTIFKIGCSCLTIARLLAAEILIIVSSSAVLCGIMLMVVHPFTNDLVRMLFIG